MATRRRPRKAFVANTKAPRSSYAITRRGPRGQKIGAYPINTLARARNALARVSQHGSAADKAKVKAAVKRKYPALARRSRMINPGGTKRPGTRRRSTRRTSTRRRRSTTGRRRR